MIFRVLALVGAMMVVSGAADAHDLWLTVEGNAGQRQIVVKYGHPGDRPPVAAEKIVELNAIDAGGTASLRDVLTLTVRENALVALSPPFSDRGSLLSARYDNGFWLKTRSGFVNATRRSARDVLESLWSGKFAKAVSGPDAPWSRVVGHDLEIVPLADPVAVRAGEMLRVRVLFRGEPLPDVQVERGDGKSMVPEADIPRFKTDAEGIAAIPVVSGPQLLVVDHRVAPSAAPDQADADLFNATLWFEIAANLPR